MAIDSDSMRRVCRAVTASGFGATVLALATTALAVVDDPNFVETEVLAEPGTYTGMAWAPDGSQRLFLLKKEGTVHVVENGVLLPTPFATMSPIYTGSECGLIGLAFDPNFGENGFVYFFVTVSSSEQQILRYRADGNVGVDRTVLVEGLPTNGANHDGGALGFGPDGKLYWAIGDLGGGVGVDDDLQSMAAKVGRVNRDGTAPEDNPFHDGPGPNDERIWARGFRNPFTMTFQPSTGKLWLNVVGTYQEQIFVVERGDHGGYDEHESRQPEQFITATIHYPTHGNETHALTDVGAVRSGGITTFTTVTRHWFHPGMFVTIAGVGDASFDGTGFVRSAPSDTVFTIEQAGPDAASGGGQVSSSYLGGCVTGGTFYDSTAASEEYRENFFFGDLKSGLIVRVRVSGTSVHSIEPWASGHLNVVDMDVGPDGDLYHVSHSGPGGLFRVSFVAERQRIVASKRHVRMLEAGVAALNVRLARDPGETIRVNVARSGDRDVTVTEGAVLEFDSSDYDVPKVVRLAARADLDTSDDVAELDLSAAGLDSERVLVRVTDEFELEPPGEGGAGGEGGHSSGGEPSAGGRAEGGEAGDDPAGGRSGRAGEGPSAGRDGSAGMGGEDAGGAPNGGAGRAASDSGCGCAVGRRSGGGFAALALAALWFRRRAARR